MHFYLFDSFLTDKKYKKRIIEIENRISELGIEGKYTHLTVLKNFNTSLHNAIDRELKTIVVIGNDKTIYKAINALADVPITLGIIPLGKQCKIAQYLGIPENKLAVDIVANRLTEKLDLGKINNHYFISSVQAGEGQFFLDFDGKYEINLTPDQTFSINNLGKIDSHICNPKDGLLETMIFLQAKSFFSGISQKFDSVFHNKKIRIIASDKKSSPLILDHSQILKTPAEVKIAPKKIKVIVGRKRVF